MHPGVDGLLALPQPVLERMASSFAMGSPEPSRLAGRNKGLHSALSQRSKADALVYRVLPGTRHPRPLELNMPAAMQQLSTLPATMRPDVVEELAHHIRPPLFQAVEVPAMLASLLENVLAIGEPSQRLRVAMQLASRLAESAFIDMIMRVPMLTNDNCDTFFDALHAFADTLGAVEAAAMAPHLAAALLMVQDREIRSSRWNAFYVQRDASAVHRPALLAALADVVPGLGSAQHAKAAARAMLALYPGAEPALRTSILGILINFTKRTTDPNLQLGFLEKAYRAALDLPSVHAAQVYCMTLANLRLLSPLIRLQVFNVTGNQLNRLEMRHAVECTREMARAIVRLPAGAARAQGIETVCQRLLPTVVGNHHGIVLPLRQIIEQERGGALPHGFFSRLCHHAGALAAATRREPIRLLIALLAQLPTRETQRAGLHEVEKLVDAATGPALAAHLLQLNALTTRLHAAGDRQAMLARSISATERLPEGDRPAVLVALLRTACRLADSMPLEATLVLLQDAVRKLSPAGGVMVSQAIEAECEGLADSLRDGIACGSMAVRQLDRFDALNEMAKTLSGTLREAVVRQVSGVVQAAIDMRRPYAGRFFALCKDQLPEDVRQGLASRLEDADG